MRGLLALALLAPAYAFFGAPTLHTSSAAVSRRPQSFSRPGPLSMSATPAGMALETLIVSLADETMLKIRFPVETYKDLVVKSNSLLASFRAIKAAAQSEEKGPVKREPSMTFVCDHFNTHLEFECNPNLYPDAFHAEVYIKVKNDVMEVTSQCHLSSLVDALKVYKNQYKVQLEQPAGASK